jgi:hypothetical protein
MKQDSVSDSVAGTGRVTVRAIAAETGLSIARRGGSNGTSIHKATRKHAITAVMDLSAPDDKPHTISSTQTAADASAAAGTFAL